MKIFQNKAKIVAVSKIVRSILFAGLVFWILGILISLVDLIVPICFLSKDTLYSSTTFTLGWMALLASLGLIINLKLFRFFGRLKNGYLFDAQTVGYLDSAGKWWILFWLCEGLLVEIRYQVFQLKMMTWDSGGLFAGLILIFVAWLLKEAQELQEEQALTV